MEDLKRVAAACGGAIQTSLGDLSSEVVGVCGLFEERQVGNERYNYFTECEHARSATIILRGGADQFIEETHRSLWDALMVVKRCVQHSEIVGGAGAIEMELSRYLRDVSNQVKDKSQLIMASYAKALEVIPRQLAQNAGLDATDIVNNLRYLHANGNRWAGVNIENGGTLDAVQSFIWEPLINKKTALSAATEAACTILAIDETIKNAKAENNAAGNQTVPNPTFQRRSMGKPSIM